jgi:putative DNA methylase
MSDFPIKSPRKLIEVALPLDAINEACAAEKQPGIGSHPRSLHLWWARRPLAAARAVIFAQLVNDPGFQQGKGFRYGMNKKDAAEERKRLFKIIEDLVKWENTTNEEVLERARAEIRRSWREVCELNKDHPQASELFNPANVPALHDPFAGGGAIPLEAQRLGLEAYASDLNPVPVLINKAMIEIPPRFAGRPPVSLASKKPRPGEREQQEIAYSQEWSGAAGLAEDVRHYGEWMRLEAEKRIGHLYPPIEITVEMGRERPDLKSYVGQKLAVIAWLWARTVKSPNPAFSHVDVPLASTFVLSSKDGKECYVQPIVDGEKYHFTIRLGKPSQAIAAGTKASGRGANFRCLVSDTLIDGHYIKSEGQAGRIGAKLLAVVADGPRGRIYLPPSASLESVAKSTTPNWKPTGEVPARLTGGTCVPYGLKEWGDLFTPRQLVALTTFSDLIGEAREQIAKDAVAADMTDDSSGLEEGGSGSKAYTEAVSVYLAFAIARLADYNSSIATWKASGEQVMQTFKRQAIPMTWDFPESNILGQKAICWKMAVKYAADNIEAMVDRLSLKAGHVFQADAQNQNISKNKVISTDPPYYDNIGYADLSDYFYVWHRKTLRDIYPSLFSTISVPKAEELVASSYRHGGKESAESFFLGGMKMAMRSLSQASHPASPITIYYAFKQSETDSDGGTASTGWETFLEAVSQAGLQLSGTWPLRTELANKVGMSANMLASSIVLVCRKRPADAPTVSRREFIRELNWVLPEALDEMTKGAGEGRSPVAPVDLSQAIIGPGMAVFSKYAAVLEADGSAMSVRSALQLINRFLAEDDFDHDTQWCLLWFEQHGWEAGVFGDADVLARSKSISVDGLVEAGVVRSGSSKVSLIRWPEYPSDWNPKTDTRNPIWETLHHLIRALKSDGETGAGKLLAAVKGQTEAVRQLSYRLHTLCERQGRADDARAYNELMTSWTAIEGAANETPSGQGDLFG